MNYLMGSLMARCLCTLLALAALLVAVPASGSVIVLKFEGIGNLTPAGDTLMPFLDADDWNVPAGFDAGFSSFDTSAAAASVNVLDGLDPTGNVLGTLSLEVQDNPIALEDIASGSEDPVGASVTEPAATVPILGGGLGVAGLLLGLVGVVLRSRAESRRRRQSGHYLRVRRSSHSRESGRTVAKSVR